MSALRCDGRARWRLRGAAALAWVVRSSAAEFSGFADAVAGTPTCSEEAVQRAFAAGDVSLARAELCVYKGAPKAVRDCAARLWREGVADVIARGAQAGGAAESAVLGHVGLGRCAVSVEDGSWLDIPRVQEVLVCPRAGGRALVLEQDGFLRAFDMSTVLWPAGFFLSLWAFRHCPALAGARVLELGAGVGGPSVASALCGAQPVLATDREAHAVVNLRANARANAANVTARVLDWDDDAQVAEVVAQGPFDVVFGAGLAPSRWAPRLLAFLARLLRPGGGRAVLSHGAGDLEGHLPEVGGLAASGLLRLEGVVPGDDYGLRTRWGTPSEFEIVVFARERAGAHGEL